MALGVLVALRVVRLVSGALTAPVGAEPAGLFHHLLHRIDLGVVDGGGANLLGQGQPTGPAPKTTTESPGSTPAISVAW